MNPPNRWNWIDAMRGLGIIAVVTSHTPPIRGYPFTDFLFSFHMPLFFLLCGMMIKTNEQGFFDYMKGKIARRLVPYVAFGLLSFLTISCISRFRDHNSWRQVGEMITTCLPSFIIGRPVINVALWFFATLFFAELIVWPILKIKSPLRQFCIAVIVVVLSLFCHSIDPRHIFICLENAGVAMSLILIGKWFRPLIFALSQNKKAIWLFPFSLALSVLFWSWNTRVDMRVSEYGNILLFYLSSCSGFLLVFSLGLTLQNSTLLTKIGKASLLIFPLHIPAYPFMAAILMVLFDILPSDQEQSLLIGVFTVIVLIISFTAISEGLSRIKTIKKAV